MLGAGLHQYPSQGKTELDTDTSQGGPIEETWQGGLPGEVGIAARIQWDTSWGTSSTRKNGHWNGVGVGTIIPILQTAN